MNTQAKSICYIATICSLCLVGFGQSISCAAEGQAQSLSLSFNDLPVSAVMDLIEETSGVKISITKSLDQKKVTRIYVNQTMEAIISDVLKGVSHAFVWFFGDSGVESVDIWIFDQSRGWDRKEYASLRAGSAVNIPEDPGIETADEAIVMEGSAQEQGEQKDEDPTPLIEND